MLYESDKDNLSKRNKIRINKWKSDKPNDKP